MQSPIMISVSGPTLKSVHEQVLNMAEEIKRTNGTVELGGKISIYENENQKNGKFSQPESKSQDSMAKPSEEWVSKPTFATLKVETNVPGTVELKPVPGNPNLVQPTFTAQPLGSTDSDGLPWDARIHASSREKTATGQWRKRRGLDDALKASVEAELRSGTSQAPVSQPEMATPVQQVSVQTSPIPAIPTTPTHVALPDEGSVLNQIPLKPIITPPIVQQLPPNTHNVESFRNNLVNILTKLSNEGRIGQTYIESLKQWFGKEVYEFANDAEKCTALFNTFVEEGLINKL